MILAVPSKGRLNYTIGKVFPQHTLFVEPQDLAAYREKFPNQEIVDIGRNDMGFGYVCQKIVEYVLSKGQRYFLFTDDDIWGVVRKDKQPFNVDRFLFEAEQLLRETNYAQIGVCFQGHGHFYPKKLTENKGIWGLGIYDAEKIMRVGGYDQILMAFNDYEITARLLMNGYKVAIWSDYLFQHKMKSQNGGLMGFYKNPELMKRQAYRVKKRYGDVCKVIYHEEHGFFEIRFRWSKLLTPIQKDGVVRRIC